jgi:hypothetical protein
MHEQELATAATCVAAGSELGWSWRSRKRAAGEGNRAGVGEERCVEVKHGRRWRGAARNGGWQRSSRGAEEAPEEEEEGRGSEGSF